MFEKTKRGTQFLLTKDEDMMNALIKGSASTKELSSSTRAKIAKKLASFKAFRASVPGIAPRTAYLIVRNPSTRLVGVVHNEKGITDFDADLAVLSMTRKHEVYSIFETFWADGIFWKKYVSYAFRKRIFGGPQLEKVEEEQRRVKITTNRDGWVNGKTWWEQHQDGTDSPAPGMLIGGQRGDADEPRTLRGAINFS